MYQIRLGLIFLWVKTRFLQIKIVLPEIILKFYEQWKRFMITFDFILICVFRWSFPPMSSGSLQGFTLDIVGTLRRPQFEVST